MSDAPRPSGVALLFDLPAAGPTVPLEQLLAQREADAFAAGAAAADAAAAARIGQLLADHTAECARIESAHAEAIAALESAHRTALAALEQALADLLAPLALAITRAVIGAEPSPQTIAALAREAASALPEGAIGILRPPPGQPCSALPGWTVQEDASLPPGTVRAELGATVVTAALANRLEQIARETGA